jgi:hypothetical protein
MLRPLLSPETTLMVVLIAVKADSLKSPTTELHHSSEGLP